MTIAYSLGRNRHDKAPVQRSAQDLDAFLADLDAHRAPKKETAAYICGPLNGDGKRCAEGTLPRRWLAVDLDRIDPDRQPDVRIWFARFRGCAWPTHSSTPTAPRERVILELDRDVDRGEAMAVGEALAADLGEEFGQAIQIDPCTFRGEQPVFVPPVGATFARFEGEPLEVARYLRARKAPEQDRHKTEGKPGEEELLTRVNTLGRKLRTGDGRRDLLTRYIASRIGRGLKVDDVRLLIAGIGADYFDPADPIDEKDVAEIVQWAEGKEQEKKQAAAGADGDLIDREAHLPENWQEVNPPKRPFVLLPYIPRRAVSALIGAGTSSKTMIVCEWAAAITTGTDWRGHPVAEGDVLIVTWEDCVEDYHAKLYSLLQQRTDLQPYAKQIRDRLHFLQMHGGSFYLVAPDTRGRPATTLLAQRIVEHVRSRWPDTVQVFVETVSRANATDETNEAMAMVVAAGEVIAHALDVGVTDVHHVSKAAANAGVIDATAGRGGTALPDNCRATTVAMLVDAESPPRLHPPGFTAADFDGREIVLVVNSRSSYARSAAHLHLERRYPGDGAPYLVAASAPERVAEERVDGNAEKLLAWLTEKLADGRKAERAIVDRRDEYGLSERHARAALARLVEGGQVLVEQGKQHGDKGKAATFYRLPPQQQPLG